MAASRVASSRHHIKPALHRRPRINYKLGGILIPAAAVSCIGRAASRAAAKCGGNRQLGAWARSVPARAGGVIMAGASMKTARQYRGVAKRVAALARALCALSSRQSSRCSPPSIMCIKIHHACAVGMAGGEVFGALSCGVGASKARMAEID